MKHYTPPSPSDYITSYNVTLPVQLRNGQVPTGITLVFQAHYFTQYDSNLTSSITYFWQFDDQTTLTTDDSTVTFAYPRPGNYTFRLLLVGVSVRAPDFSEDIMVFLGTHARTCVCVCACACVCVWKLCRKHLTPLRLVL